MPDPPPTAPGSASPAAGASLSGQSPQRRRRPLVSRSVGTCLFLGVFAGVLAVWWLTHRHFLASSALALRGGRIEWSGTGGTWLRGGRTSVDLSTAGHQANDKDMVSVTDLNHVIALNLSSCWGVTESGLALLSRLPELEALDLGRSEQSQWRQIHPMAPRLTNRVLDHVAGLGHLRELNLSGMDLTDQGLVKLAALRNLEVLDLSGTRVTNAGLMHLKGLARLRTLVVDSPGVTPEGSAALRAANPSLNIEFPTMELPPPRTNTGP